MTPAPERDRALGRALRSLDAPPATPRFWADLSSRLAAERTAAASSSRTDAASAVGAPAAAGAPAALPVAEAPEAAVHGPASRRGRRPLVPPWALAAAAVAAVFGLVTLAVRPDGSETVVNTPAGLPEASVPAATSATVGAVASSSVPSTSGPGQAGASIAAPTTAPSPTAPPTTRPPTAPDGDLTPPPWSGPALAQGAVPGVLVEAWEAAGSPSACAALAFDDLGTGAGATPRTADFGSGAWAVAYDQPDAPGVRSDGTFDPAAGRSTFGIAGTSLSAGDDRDDGFPFTFLWSDASRADYGPEGGTGPKSLAYLQVAGQGCLYNVWSHLGEAHLEHLLAHLRFVEGAGAPDRPR